MARSKVSIRYAKSLLDLAREKDALSSAQEDMATISDTIDQSRDLQLMLKSPIITSDKKLSILKEVFKDKIGPFSTLFVEIITKKGREKLLGEIAQAAVLMAKEEKNIFGAQVTTAVPLDDATRQKVLAIIKEIKSGTIELEEVVDPTIIGGFQLRVGDSMIDSSVVGKVRELSREFSENPYIP
ncbi:MAG: ATP synthase F1 subunit delta [Flavobacteriales bacterium]|nr:ATP synthase F1 subunit delta [Flavobacteriales bacterium]